MHDPMRARLACAAIAAALIIAVAPASFGQTSAEPATADAPGRTTGTVETWTFAFNLSIDVPANGSLLVTFPDGFALTSESACHIQAPANRSAGTSVLGPTHVACHLDGNGSVANGTDVVLDVTAVRDPATAAPSGAFRIDVRDENATVIATHEAPSVDITPHPFSAGPVQSNGDHRTSHVDTHTFDFTLFNAWQADGRFEIVFPSSYGVDAAGQGTSQATFTAGPDGDLQRQTASGTTLAFQRTDGTDVAGGTSITVEVTQIRNPAGAGWTDPFIVRTLAGAGGVHDEGQASGVYISSSSQPAPTSSPPASPSPSPTAAPDPSPSQSPTADPTTSPTEPAGVAQEANDTPPDESEPAGPAPRNWDLGGGPGEPSPAPTVAAVLVVLGLAGAAVAVARRRRA